jgi:hypothetical protein
VGTITAQSLGLLLADAERAVLGAFEDFGRHDDAPQIRRAFNLPAWDSCDVCYLSLPTVARAQLTGPSKCATVTEVRLRLELVRCWPGPFDNGAPDVEGENRASAKAVADATTLWYGITARRSEGTLLPSWTGLDCEKVRLGDLVANGPNGGYVSWQWDWRIELAGYPRS